MSEQTFVIVGASLAGAKAAEALREHGREGRVALVGSEPLRPYLRPPLSKGYLRGDVLGEAVSTGRVRRLGDDLYEMAEPSSPARTA
jgi:3-phenylpropionate/trans-cinnamate dioxygenase ferredoxin reductase subunit